MKKRLIPFLAILAALALVAAACGDDADDTTTTTAAEPATVLDLAIEAGQFSTLIAAIEAAGLGETLQGEGPFTVFAPTDAAFEAAFEALGITAAELLADTETLTAILTYHVLPQAADSQLVSTLDGQMVETVNGQSVTISVTDGAIMVDQATVVSADLIADNGIVHVINAVMLPPDIATALGVAMEEEMTDETTTTAAPETTTTAAQETTTTTEAPAEPTIAEIVAASAAADPAEFTVLLAALETAGLVEALNNPDDELTVFAPTDEAFAGLLAALDITAEELLARDDLADILLYHVSAEGVFDAAAVLGAAPIEALPTLNPGGATLKIEVIDGDVVINDGSEPLGGSTVVQADVFASNGVIHVIDVVLIPAA